MLKLSTGWTKRRVLDRRLKMVATGSSCLNPLLRKRETYSDSANHRIPHFITAEASARLVNAPSRNDGI